MDAWRASSSPDAASLVMQLRETRYALKTWSSNMMNVEKTLKLDLLNKILLLDCKEELGPLSKSDSEARLSFKRELHEI